MNSRIAEQKVIKFDAGKFNWNLSTHANFG